LSSSSSELINLRYTGYTTVAGMSLFKAREWWCTTVGENELFDLGCLCVADVTSTHSGRCTPFYCGIYIPYYHI